LPDAYFRDIAPSFAGHESFIAASCAGRTLPAMIQNLLDKLTTDPLVPAGLLLCWLLLEWLARRRLRRDSRRRVAIDDRS